MRSPQIGCLPLLVLLSAGCWYNPKAAMHPYGLPDIDFRQSPGMAPPRRPASTAASPQVIIAPRWANEISNPVGGLYDYSSYTVTPLYRTYFHPDISIPIWEGCVDYLRQAGYRTYKDYSDQGNPALVKKPAPRLQAVMLTGRMTRALHDQLRELPEDPGFEAAYIEVELALTDLRGKPLWKEKKVAQLKVPFNRKVDLLDGLGRALGYLLLRDKKFTSMLASAARQSLGQPSAEDRGPGGAAVIEVQ